jgi:hypothetical protein
MQVPAGEYGRSVAAKLHSALQRHLNACCLAANKTAYQIQQLPPYSSLYTVYCSKKRDRALNKAAAAAGGGRSAVVHLSLGKDPYVRGCHKLLASGKLEDAELLSLVTSQTAMVAWRCTRWDITCSSML